MGQFEVSEPADGGEIHLRADKNDAAASVERLFPGDTVTVLTDPGEDADWSFAEVSLPGAAGPKGWLATRHLGAPLDPLDYPPVAPDAFTRAAARYELAINSGGAPTPAAYADYLIAWALLESDLTKFGPQVDGSDANGPFQLSSAEWQDFLAGRGEAGFYTADHRFRANLQIAGAGFIAERDRLAFIAKVTAGGGDASPGEPVPGDTLVVSFLNILHCRMLGVDGAALVAAFHKNDQGDDFTIDAILTQTVADDALRNQIIARYSRFLKPGADFLTVDAFYTKTEDALNDAFKSAATLFREHAPDFIPAPPGGTTAPWVDIAIAERDTHWRDVAGNVLKENDTAATVARVVKYFKSTSFHPDKVHHWCGAFVAHCLNEAGGRIADTVIRDGARAANWKTWGDRELRVMVNIPRGAVVVLKPGKGTGGSGHVGFFMGFQQGSAKKKVELLGGNQSDTVRVSTFKTSQIAAIRWFGDVNQELETGDATPVPGPMPGVTENDVLIMARTLWAECRGEPVPGQHAVAGVILNRARSARYPDSIAKVCLQAFQFSCWNANAPGRDKLAAMQPDMGNAVFDALFQMAGRAIAGAIADTSNGALHYHATSVNPGWAKAPPAVVSARIGAHIFYTDVP